MITTAPVSDAAGTVRRSLTGSIIPIKRSWKFIKISGPGKMAIMMENIAEENEQLAILINKDLGSAEEGLVIASGLADRNAIRQKLAILIAHLMENNFEKLCQAMYRLDVSETRFDRVMNETPLHDIPYSVADLVIERELQKVKTRLMHKRGEL